jgi:2Fe-2S ferredoxin
MVRIVYEDVAGVRKEVDAEAGATLMAAAVRGGVVAIEGECGGAMACATCHLHVPGEWREITGQASCGEREMLECANDVDERSRLGCQIVVTAAMDGMTVFTPRSQR